METTRPLNVVQFMDFLLIDMGDESQLINDVDFAAFREKADKKLGPIAYSLEQSMLRADLLTVVTRGADDKFFNPISLGAQDNIDWAVVVSGRMRAVGRKASPFIKEGWTRIVAKFPELEKVLQIEVPPAVKIKQEFPESPKRVPSPSVELHLRNEDRFPEESPDKRCALLENRVKFLESEIAKIKVSLNSQPEGEQAESGPVLSCTYIACFPSGFTKEKVRDLLIDKKGDKYEILAFAIYESKERPHGSRGYQPPQRKFAIAVTNREVQKDMCNWLHKYRIGHDSLKVYPAYKDKWDPRKQLEQERRGGPKKRMLLDRPSNGKKIRRDKVFDRLGEEQGAQNFDQTPAPEEDRPASPDVEWIE